MEGVIELHFVPTEQQTADIFTKALPESTFVKLVNELGMVNYEKWWAEAEMNTDEQYWRAILMSNPDAQYGCKLIQNFKLTLLRGG